MEYNGGRTENDIVNWIMKRVGPPSTEVTCAVLKEKVAAAPFVLAFFGDSAGMDITQYTAFIGTTTNKLSEKF